MKGDLRPEQQREQRRRKPRAQVRSQARDLALRVQLKQQRVVDAQPARGGDGDRARRLTLGDRVLPAQPVQRGIDGAEQYAQVLAPAEHEPSGQRRDELGVCGERGDDPVEVVGGRRRAEPPDGVGKPADVGHARGV
jgi:hypothetical protein